MATNRQNALKLKKQPDGDVLDDVTRAAWQRKKASVLAELQSSEPDLSPKGEPDKAIIPLLKLLNSHKDIVTTSSCSGRLSVFLDGTKKSETTSDTNSNIERGRWLFSSHEPVDTSLLTDENPVTSLLLGAGQRYSRELGPWFKLSEKDRLVHLKFEPMIMHIAASHTTIAQRMLQCAVTSSFRESGISGSKWPVVAVRTNGLMFDSPIGVFDEQTGVVRLILSEEGLRMLLDLANMRFLDNTKRVDTFTAAIRKLVEESNVEQAPEPPKLKGKARATETNEQHRNKEKDLFKDTNDGVQFDEGIDFLFSEVF